MRLLVVEDNVELSNLLANGLRRAGYEIDVFATAAEADAAAGRREAARTEWQRAVALSAKPRDTADEVLRQYYYAGSLRARMEAALTRWGVDTRPAAGEGGSA